MPRQALLAAAALAGVVVSVAFVLLGLPEANPVQSTLLELSALPLSVTVAALVAMLQQRAARRPGRRSLVVLLLAGGLVVLGLGLICWAYAFGPREVVHTGQLLIWLGLFPALVVMVRLQPRRSHVRFELGPEADGDDAPAASGDDDPEPADSGLKPSI